MGTDYYLADPEAKEVFYIDRCGCDFAHADPAPEFQTLKEWPPSTPVRVITRETFDDVGWLAPEDRHRGTFHALAWCAGRQTVLLISDQGSGDDQNHDFCFRINHGEGVPGWTGKDFDDRR